MPIPNIRSWSNPKFLRALRERPRIAPPPFFFSPQTRDGISPGSIFPSTAVCTFKKYFQKIFRVFAKLGLDNPYAFCYNSKAIRPVGQAAKTPPSQGGNMGSIPVRVTTKKKALAFASAFFRCMRLIALRRAVSHRVDRRLAARDIAFGSYVPSESEALSLCASKISRRAKRTISLRALRAISPHAKRAKRAFFRFFSKSKKERKSP